MTSGKVVQTTAFVIICCLTRFCLVYDHFEGVSNENFVTLETKRAITIMLVLYFFESRARCPGYITVATLEPCRKRCSWTGPCSTGVSRDITPQEGAPLRQRCALHMAGPSPPAAPVSHSLWKLINSAHKNWQRGFLHQLVEGAFLNWFSLLCFLPRNNLLLFEWSSSWRFLSREENLWRRRCSSLFLWQTLFCHWIWLNSML